MTILFAVIFLVLIFKCVGLGPSEFAGKLLGAVLSLVGFVLSLAVGAVLIWTFYCFCSSAFPGWNCMAGDSDSFIVKHKK